MGVLSTAKAQDPDIKATIAYTPVPITADGIPDDAAWAGANEYSDFTTAVGGENLVGVQDLSGKWRALWDESNLYLLIEVEDDSIIVGDSGDWRDDGVEIHLDTGALGKGAVPQVVDYGPGFGPNTFPVYQLTLLAGEVTLLNSINHLKWVELNGASNLVNGGAISEGNIYRFELALPWSTLGDTTPDEIIARGFFGLGFGINDDDDGGERDTQFIWGTPNINLWNDAGQFPDVALGAPNAPPLQIVDLELDPVSGAATVTFTSRPNQIYIVDASFDLKLWFDINDNVIGSAGDTTECIDIEAGDVDAKFYRARKPGP